jgi:hypothetical protein
MAKKQKGKQKAPSPTHTPAPGVPSNTIPIIEEVSEVTETIGLVPAPKLPSTAPAAAVTTQHRRVHIQEEEGDGEVNSSLSPLMVLTWLISSPQPQRKPMEQIHEAGDEWHEDEYDEAGDHTGWERGEGNGDNWNNVGDSEGGGATTGWDAVPQSQAPAAATWGTTQDQSAATTMPPPARTGWANERGTMSKTLTSAGGGTGWDQTTAAMDEWTSSNFKQAQARVATVQPTPASQPRAQAQGWTNWANEVKAVPQAAWQATAMQSQNPTPIQAQASWTTWAKEANMAPPKANSHGMGQQSYPTQVAQHAQALRSVLTDPYQARMAAAQQQQQRVPAYQAQAHTARHIRERSTKKSKHDQSGWGSADDGGWGTSGGGGWGTSGAEGRDDWGEANEDGWGTSGAGDDWGQSGSGWGNAEGDSGWGHKAASSWGDIVEEEDEWDDDEEDWEDSRRVRFAEDDPGRAAAAAAAAAMTRTPVTQSVPASRTMAMATGGAAIPGVARVAASPEKGDASVQVIESSGAAVNPAQMALFGRDRTAKNRIYWGLSPHQDKRVVSLLAWVNAMNEKVAALGVRSPFH